MGEPTVLEEKLMEFMKSRIETLETPSTFPYIYKVPKELKFGHQYIFEPKWISIGPLHHDENRPSQNLKKWYLKNFIGRLNPNPAAREDTKRWLAKNMSNLESLKIEEHYRDMDPNLKGHKFAEIMLLDGCFIIELLLTFKETLESSMDKFFETAEKVPLRTLKLDLLKIENQIPFEVLEMLVNPEQITGVKKSPSKFLTELALDFFEITIPPQNFTTDQPKHFLELVRKTLFHIHRNNNVPDSSSSSLIVGQAKTASEMVLYGVQFKARKRRNLTEIEFVKTDGVLEIPLLEIRESTATEFWNYLVSEMFSPGIQNFTAYAVLMDTLINNERDVEVLVRSGVLVLRNNDVNVLLSLFNDLTAIVTLKKFYYGALIEEVNRYCDGRYNRVRAYWMRYYYDRRWDVLNSVLIFTLTVTQTLFSVLSYNPKSEKH